jgi:hypothetical protein
MNDVYAAIVYGTLDVDIPEKLTLRQQLEVVRMVVVNPSAMTRLILPEDFHPWARLLLSK